MGIFDKINFNTNKVQNIELQDEFIVPNKQVASPLGLQLAGMVRDDEEYAKFNKYMK